MYADRPRANSAPSGPEPQDVIAAWRKLAIYLYSAVDLSLDCSPSERISILTEAATEADARIDELDRNWRAA
jgi:hypothetical protein